MDKPEREIPVEIFENGKEMRVIAEVPGVNEEDIRLVLNHDSLYISASQANRNYYKNVKLPRASQNIVRKLHNTGINKKSSLRVLRASVVNHFSALQSSTNGQQTTINGHIKWIMPKNTLTKAGCSA